MRRVRALSEAAAWIAASCAVALVGCGDGLDAALGDEALVRVEGAVFVAEPLPQASDGPEVLSAVSSTNVFRPGEVDKPVSGTLEADATALLVGLEGDAGHWRVVAQAPSVSQPDQPTFALRLAFSPDILRSTAQLAIQAVDARGAVGAPALVTLEQAQSEALDAPLVFTLRWDRDADLDLKVVTPEGVEISSQNPNSAEPARPGQPPSAEALAAGGAFERDSNAQCTIDGARQERVVWTQAPPAGRYLVRVDTFSMCDQPSARWVVEAHRGGALVAQAQGHSGPLDARQGRGQGAGVLALFLDVEAP